jgi:hypothetical protein
MWLKELPYFVMIIGAVMVGLYLSNYFLDKGVEQYISRKVGHGIAGIGFLLCAFLFTTGWYPMILAAGFVALLGLARIVKPDAFRGVGGSSRKHAFAEVFLPGAAVIAIVIGWIWLNNPWLAVVPILYVCFGDMVTGIVRSRIYHVEIKGNYGSLAMILTCLLVAYFFPIWWIAACGAVVATAAEKFTPRSHGIWDDNWTITLSSLLVMALLYTYAR